MLFLLHLSKRDSTPTNNIVVALKLFYTSFPPDIFFIKAFVKVHILSNKTGCRETRRFFFDWSDIFLAENN